MPNESSKTKAKAKKSSPQPKGGGKKSCTVTTDGKACPRAYRAKGFCFFHYKKWRAGELPHGRYKTCSNPECKKKVAEHGLCEEHFKAWKGSRKGAVAAAAPAA